MKELTIDVPAHLESEVAEVAASIGVSVDALIGYFFGREVVHTRENVER